MSANEKPDGLEAELARRAREIESRVDAINLAAQPAQAGEAVAWGYRGRDGKIHPAVDRLFAESLARALSGPHGRPDNGPWEAVPLYTHPTPRAQPAPEWAGEKCPRCACERNTRGAVSGANGRFAGACSDEFHGEAPDPDATPRAEAASAEAVARAAALNACELIAGNPVLLTSDAVDAIVDRAVAHALRAQRPGGAA